MKIKVYGWTGRKPDLTTFETFEGDSALAVVLAMMATPYAANLTPHQFMSNSLATIAPGGPALPREEAPAADTYLARLAETGLTEPV